jgi:hypothetical protein
MFAMKWAFATHTMQEGNFCPSTPRPILQAVGQLTGPLKLEGVLS